MVYISLQVAYDYFERSKHTKYKYMKTIKVMSIIGLVMAVLSMLCIIGFQYSDSQASMGWGVIAVLYLIALSIVGIVQGGKKTHE